MPEPVRGSGFRTLTESLRQRMPDSVITLVSLRPDLAQPLPHDLAELTAHATMSHSVLRALDGLTAWQREIAEALAALPDPASVEAAAELLAADLAPCWQAVDDLRQRALLWGSDERLHLLRAVREQFGPYPGALAPPSPRPLTTAQVETLLAECDPKVAEVLERLAWSPTGALAGADRPVSTEAARGPVEQLLARRLLQPLNSDTVILPREVAWLIRGKRFSREPAGPEPPAVAGHARKPELIDRAAAGTAYGVVHDLEQVGHALESRVHRLLRDGGLGQRDVNALAREVGGDPEYAGFLLECGAATVFASGPDGALLPTREFDRWIRRSPLDRWWTVVRGWRDSGRLFSRSAQTDAHPLGPEADLPYAANLRTVLLDVMVDAGIGLVPDDADLAAAVRWHRPRLARVPLRLEQGIDWLRREAAWLGLTALGATSSLLAVLAGPDQTVPGAVADLFPEPVETIIVQADLTAVASGPLPYHLAAELRLLADQESRGGGGVYRFGTGSLRRALDAGWSPARIRAWLAQHSTTTIPQPLSYLIDDVARHHGSVRVGAAGSYLTVDDPVKIAALLADPGAVALGLRQIGAEVVVANAEPDDLLAFVERLGHHPALDHDTDRVVPAKRAPTPPRDRPDPASPQDVAAAVAATVAATEPSGPDGAQRSPDNREDNAPDSTAETLHRLHAAVRAARPVSLRLVGADGAPAERRISPLDLSGGQLRGVDLSTAQVITIPLSRVLFASLESSDELD